MANNRLWLLHRPTKKAVMIGKRMGHGWYLLHPKDIGETLCRFYDHIELKSFSEMDDFQLIIEQNDRVINPVISDYWTYDDFEIFPIIKRSRFRRLWDALIDVFKVYA